MKGGIALMRTGDEGDSSGPSSSTTTGMMAIPALQTVPLIYNSSEGVDRPRFGSADWETDRNVRPIYFEEALP